MSDFFASMARKWNHLPGMEKPSIDFKAAIEKMVVTNKDMRILDFGCGTGLLGLKFISEVKTVGFLDICPEMIEVLQESIQKIGAKNAEVFAKDIREVHTEPYDLVVALFVLHHVNAMEPTLKAIFDLMKPGARFIACEVKHGDSHMTAIPENNITNMFLQIGFQNIKTAPHTPLTMTSEDGTKTVRETYTIYAEKP